MGRYSTERSRLGKPVQRLLILASQFLNTGTNLAVTFLAAAVASPSAFGAWATANVAVVLALQIGRSLVSTPMMVDPDIDYRVGSAVRSSAVSAAFVASLLLAVATALGGAGFLLAGLTPLGVLLLLSAAALPPLLAGDVLRHADFRSSRGATALSLDAANCGALVIGVLALANWGEIGVFSVTAIWATSWWVAVIGSMLVLRVGIRPTSAAGFFQRHRSDGWKLLLESLLGSGALQVLPVALAVVAGLHVAGTIRGGQAIFGAITIFIMALTPPLTTTAVHRLRRGASAERLVLPFSIAVCAASAFTVLAFVTMPVLGRTLLGQTWPPAESVIVPMAVYSASRGHNAAVAVVLRARREFTSLLRFRAWSAPYLILLPTVAGALAGLQGAAWGLAAASIGLVLHGSLALRRVRGVHNEVVEKVAP